VAPSQLITENGTLALSVTRGRVGTTVRELQTLAASFGGYLTGSDVALAGPLPGGSLVIEVPAAKFTSAIAAVERLGSVSHLRTSADDVTGQVADLAAQLTALLDARTQLEALLARAGSISALLSVENQITTTQSQIDQLQSAQRVLANEVSYSSLTVDVTIPVIHHAPASGFSQAWHRALSGFTGGVRALVGDLGVIAFALVLAALISLIGLLALRRLLPVVRRWRL
jgi:hypothetical protein